MRVHRPIVYRYEVSRPRHLRLMLNRYGWRVIGAAVVVGRWAYCAKWAKLTPASDEAA
jgi:hypothetical protein